MNEDLFKDKGNQTVVLTLSLPGVFLSKSENQELWDAVLPIIIAKIPPELVSWLRERELTDTLAMTSTTVGNNTLIEIRIELTPIQQTEFYLRWPITS